MVLSMLEDKKVVSGLRPKKKSSDRSTLTTRSKPKILNSSVNTFDRLCMSMCNWTLQPCSRHEDLVSAISDSYLDYNEYLEVWEPLFLDELKASVLGNLSHQMTNGRVSSSVSSDRSENGLVSVMCSFSSLSDESECELPAPMDLVLLSNERIDFPSDASKGVTAKHVLGVVMSGNNAPSNSFTLRTSREKWNQLQLTSSSSTSKVGQKGSLQFYVLDSLKSGWREYLALVEAQQISLFDELLCADTQNITMTKTPPSSPVLANEEASPIEFIPAEFYKNLCDRFNPSQLRAIQVSVDRPGFTLIQGPPGTGKTTTVLGILNTLHLKEYTRYYESCLKAVLDERGQRCRRMGLQDLTPWLQLVSSLSREKPHFLVVTPSNIAVDNIIQRLLDKGFLDGTGRRYNPNILRFGGGKSSSVQCVSLEEISEQEQLGALTAAERQHAMLAVDQQLRTLVEQIYAMQSYLLNLKLAFSSHTLPEGWELRVASDSGLPYWVDHLTKSASSVPPSEAALKERGQSNFRLETLPEFKIFSSKLTELIEQLSRADQLRKRCLSRIDASEPGGNRSQNRIAIESSIIDSSHILFTTLNSSGHPCLEGTDFKVTIVDEAAQSVEPSTLIPLRRGSKKCILVGDPMQLPATIFSEKVRELGYDRSLFERLMHAGHPVLLLNTQYRMTPPISSFSSRMFYQNQLLDDTAVTTKEYLPPFISSVSLHESLHGFIDKMTSSQGQPFLQPFMFFDLKSSKDALGGANSGRSQSRSNSEEAKLCISILKTLIAEAGGVSFLGSVGIISPYSEQVAEIRRRLQREAVVGSGELDEGGRRKQRVADLAEATRMGGPARGLDLEMNTVDGFQGKEKDFIIISCVRANDFGNIGFLSDVRRMNVALTRARFGMFVVGNADTLSSNQHWWELVAHAEERGYFFPIESPEASIRQVVFDQFSLLRAKAINATKHAISRKRRRNDSLEDGEEPEN